MDLKYDFEIAADVDQAWAVLLDVPRIAPCLPGAELTELVGDNQYKGTATAKLGPVKLTFAGEAELFDINNDAHTAKMKAKGSDAKGRGTANADVTFSLSSLDGGNTRIDVETDLNLAGSIAQYGRASGLIDQMAQQIIAEFVKNLEAEMATDAPAADGGAAETGLAESGGATEPAQPAPRPAADNSISGFSLFFRALGAMIKGWFSSGKK